MNEAEIGSQILSSHKVYEALVGYVTPIVLFDDAANISSPGCFGDPALRLQVLLPDVLSFDSDGKKAGRVHLF